MSNVEQIKTAILGLLNRDQRNTCHHEETHRGGAIWEICNSCGAKWADDEGGKPEWVDPPEWADGHAAIDALEALTQPEEKGIVPPDSIAGLKLAMECSAWDGKVELSDVLANIDDFAEYPQPAGEAEPVYQYQLANGNWIDQIKDSHEYNLRHGQATVRVLYTTPQQSQPLTDEQARKIIEDNDWYNFPEEVIRATEAAHGIKKGVTE